MPGSGQKTEHFARRCLVPLLCAVWLTGFLLVFFEQTLPNNPSVTRMMIVESLVDVVVGTQDAPAAAPVPSGFRFLSQRLTLSTVALTVLFTAWLQGAALVQLIHVGNSLAKAERRVLQLALGLLSFSLIVLLAGLAGQLKSSVLLTPAVASAVFLLLRRNPRAGKVETTVPSKSPGLSGSTLALECLMWSAIVAAVVWLLLGSMSPPTDFDVREYHLQGPKEWFQNGRIEYLPHNVYTSFPFYSEMFSLAAMIITGDWWTGALAGKLVLACFAPLTSATVYCITRRISNHHLGLLAALIHLTTPWTLRISIIAYAEGALSFQVAVSTLLMLILMQRQAPLRALPLIFCLGLTSGGAMAAKYTGLVVAVLPAVVVVAWHALSLQGMDVVDRNKSRIRGAMLCGGVLVAGIACSTGPWLVRNLVDTGNPVYPLGWSVFGGNEWDADVQRRWKDAHSPSEHSIARLPQHFMDVAVRNDWTSPLLFGLAIPALVLWRKRPGLVPVICMAGWQLVAWWALTHRIDRFWVPVIPLLAVVAAHARQISPHPAWRVFFIGVVVSATLFNARFCTLPLVGYHAGLQDLTAARELVIRSDLRQLNETLPDDAMVLMVGEAEVFDCTFPLIYNTVFDDSILEMLIATADSDDRDQRGVQRLRSPDEIRRAFGSRRITHVFVNWTEILRYRVPGSYGYAEFVQPEVFRHLVEVGILSPPQTLRNRALSGMSQTEQAEITTWDGIDDLMLGEDLIATVRLYAVATDE